MSSRVWASAVAVSATMRHRGKVLAQAAQRGVLGAEVVAPLRDAVGLVDGEQRDIDVTQTIEETARRSDVRG